MWAATSAVPPFRTRQSLTFDCRARSAPGWASRAGLVSAHLTKLWRSVFQQFRQCLIPLRASKLGCVIAGCIYKPAIGAGGKKQVHDLASTEQGRHHQRSLPRHIAAVRVGSCREQPPGNCRVALEGNAHQRGIARSPSRPVGKRAQIEQERRRSPMSIIAGKNEGSVPTRISGLQINAGLEQRRDHVDPAEPCRIPEQFLQTLW